MGVWMCQYCRLLNDQSAVLCASCGSQNPTVSTRVFHPVFPKLPKISLSGALNAIDSALVGIGLLPAASNSRLPERSGHYGSASALPSRQSPETVKIPLSASYDSSLDKMIGDRLYSPVAVSYSSIELLQADEKAASSEYNRIVEFCKQNNTPFIDDSFPHSKKSIGNFIYDERRGGSRINAEDLVWLRPQNIFTKDGKRYKWSIFLDPRPSDIEQGCLGNCWFLSALAVIAERPDILDQIVLTKTYNPYGVYQIRLCVDGRWQVVIVDDFFPCHKSTHGLAFAVGRRNQLWVSLIEKALAKIFGSYSKLPAGRTLEGLAILTGAPCTMLDLESSHDHDMIWAQLLSMKEAGFIMGCSCGGGKRHVDENEFKKVGLQIRHAYSLLNVVEYKNNRDVSYVAFIHRFIPHDISYRLVRLRNPWGTFTWNGPWNDTWSGWTAESRKALLPDGLEAGAFWMPFSEFVRRFDSVEIAKIRSAQGWKELRADSVSERFWGKGRVIGFQLRVRESTEMAITLYQKGSRDRCDADLMIMLHGEGPPNTAIGEVIVRSVRKNAAFVSTGDVFLHGPALYTILPISFSNMSSPENVKTVVAIHSAKMLTVEAFQYSPSVVTDSMIELCLKEGKSNACLNDIAARYVTRDFGGHILMIDNYHEKRYLHVHCDCSQSANVLSTRATLVAVDCIPPLHRQIVMLLSHFEPSQMYSVHHNLTQRLSTLRGLQDWLSFAPSSVPLPASTEHVPDITDPCIVELHRPRRICR